LHGRGRRESGLRHGRLVGHWRGCGSGRWRDGPGRRLARARLSWGGSRRWRRSDYWRRHRNRRWGRRRRSADREALGHHIGQVHHVRRPRARRRRRRGRSGCGWGSRRGLLRVRRCGEHRERGRGHGAARQASDPMLAIVHDYVCSRFKMNCSLHAARFSLDSARTGGPLPCPSRRAASQGTVTRWNGTFASSGSALSCGSTALRSPTATSVSLSTG
jgi:hypothetical protein